MNVRPLMRTQLLLPVLAASLPLSGQVANNRANHSLPKDPLTLLQYSAPYYDFSDPSLKPWHIRAAYQLYDIKGKPTEKGTFEYWWASPKVSRSTWIRPNATFTEWKLADGKSSYESTGDELSFAEFDLQSALLKPLPTGFKKSKYRLSLIDRVSDGRKLTCILSSDEMAGFDPSTPMVAQADWVSNYCFDPHLPALMAEVDIDSEVRFNGILETQKHFLPQEIVLFRNNVEILKADLTTITQSEIPVSILTPPAMSSNRLVLPSAVLLGPPLKNPLPIFESHFPIGTYLMGSIILRVAVGTDGNVKDVKVLFAHSTELGSLFAKAVKGWQFPPYLVDGVPVEVDTILRLKVAFAGVPPSYSP